MSAAAESPPAADGAGVRRGPGAALKAERARQGLSLEAVAESLHVAPRLVTAMETDDFGAFDAPVYAKGFLRKYALQLGLPADGVLAAYESLAARPEQPTLIPTLNVAPPRASLDAPIVVTVLAVIALVLGGAGVAWWSARGRPEGPGAAAPPAAEPDTAGVAPAVGAVVTPAEATPGTAVAPNAAPPAPARAVPPPSATTAAAVPARETAERRTGGRGAALVVLGEGDCWVEVYGPDGARLFYDLVHAGERRAVPGPGPWRVYLGNAGATRVAVGERPVAVPAPRHGATTARFVVAGDGTVQ